MRLLDGSATVLANVSQDINAGAPAVVPFCLTAQVSLNARVYLEGPFVVAQTVMHDSLRVHDHIPLQEPYTSLGFAQYGGGGETTTPQVLTTTGNDAIVDWIRVELRAASNNAAVVATLQALLQRDGDVVSVDGTSPLVFNVVPGSYYVAIRHRNHLGCMTLATRTLGGTPTMIDLTLNATSTFGTEARKVIGGNSVLWSGNVLVDELLKYSGVDNDRDPILQAIGGTVPTATSSGYLSADVNMDGLVKYSGVGNDRDPILSNIGGTVPTNTRLEQLP